MESKLHLPTNPNLQDFQRYVADMLCERGFDRETAPEMFMLLMEECGELAKAARKSQAIHTDPQSEKFEISEEAADVFIYLMQICNHYGVDLEKAFRDKEEINKKRAWVSS